MWKKLQMFLLRVLYWRFQLDCVHFVLLGVTSLSLVFNSFQVINRARIVPVLTNLSVFRSSSILRPSISGLLSPIQEPSDAESEIGKMNGVFLSQGGIRR